MSNAPELIPCDEKMHTITQNNLPLCCPLPSMRLWDAHPRVYLPIEKTGKAVCPYCDTTYILKDFKDFEDIK